MGIKELLARLKQDFVTPVTPSYPIRVTPKATPLLAVTPVTPVTPKIIDVQEKIEDVSIDGEISQVIKVVAGIGLHPLKAPYEALLSLEAGLLSEEERLRVGMWAISTGLVFSDFYGWASRAGIDRRTCHVEWESIEANYSHDILRKTHVS